jgi:hypothetical protein
MPMMPYLPCIQWGIFLCIDCWTYSDHWSIVCILRDFLARIVGNFQLCSLFIKILVYELLSFWVYTLCVVTRLTLSKNSYLLNPTRTNASTIHQIITWFTLPTTITYTITHITIRNTPTAITNTTNCVNTVDINHHSFTTIIIRTASPH